VADRAEPRIERAFLALISALQNSFRLKELEAELATGNLSGAEQLLDVESQMDALAIGRGLPLGKESLLDVLRDAFWAGAKAEVFELQDVIVEKVDKKPRLGTEISLDLLNPEAVNFLNGYTLNLIRQVSRDTRLAIRDVILTAFNEGGHPYEQAREIRNLIGLTSRQAQAVRNFRRMLRSGDPTLMREALERALRDKRFDSTVLRAIESQSRIPKERAERMVQRFAERMLNYRARNIARTESIRASVAGQQELWRQAVGQGLLKPERTRKKWIVTPDDRLCPICRPIPGRNKGGVRLDESFATDIGPVDAPPAHPSCRCALGLVFLKRGEA
jgi:hypothetical protein